jgi:polyisoprenoid-binding protein YceI
MTASAIETFPGYLAGTWAIDPVHSDVGFTVRHMMVSKVRGHFARFEGEIVTGADPLDSSVNATIDLTSIDTNNEQRDGHIRSADFFEVETYPTMTYRSSGVRRDGDDFILDGDLTLKGVTKRVPLRLELNGFGPDAYGGTRAGFSASADINRREFGVNFNAALETGGAVVADKVSIHLEIETVLQATDPKAATPQA